MHADHIEDEETKRRRKWAEFIANNPEAFYAALKGISVARLQAETDQAIEQDFAPDPLTNEEQECIQNMENDMPSSELHRKDGVYWNTEIENPEAEHAHDYEGGSIELTEEQAHAYARSRGVDLKSIEEDFQGRDLDEQEKEEALYREDEPDLHDHEMTDPSSEPEAGKEQEPEMEEEADKEQSPEAKRRQELGDQLIRQSWENEQEQEQEQDRER